MKTTSLLLALFFSYVLFLFAQKPTQSTIFGARPDTVSVVSASNLEAFMDKKPRISTTIRGKVIKVTRVKGGWFDIDAGNGKVISAHFRDYNINIPANIKGRTVIAEGVAQKQFIADDQQHFAGDTVSGKKQQNVKTNPKRKLTFEVKGMMIEK